ncbi:ABC transporter permease [Clostridium sp. YIM B02505]|uniref:ABC transporter permease n=1 Tax=Clostridium yunnanense TaxID=2800325 RepID=A0ABS1ENS6_9CLOT|nr:ABC transporter permease [Clostridium yunnanense]MBK1810928.1 ABC transporter permease [Clostridium yunnanense]
MNLLTEIRKNLISFIRQNKIIFILFIICPMIGAYVYGVMQEDVFSGKSSFEPITVEFQYDKTSLEGKVLEGMLSTKEVKNFINSEAKDDIKCKVVIDKTFNDIEIEKISGSDSSLDMVQSFMRTFSDNINQYKVLYKNIEGVSSNDQEKKALTNNIIGKLQEIQKVASVKDKIIQGYKSLGSREYYTISIFSFSSTMIMLTLIKLFYKEKRIGILRRAFSTPNKKTNYLAGYLSSSFIIVFIINVAYILINRILGIAFTTSILWILITVILQSLLQASVIGFIIAFVKSEKVSNAIISAATALQLMIGGVFYSIDMTGSSVLKVISNFSPNTLIINSYKNLAIVSGDYGALNQIIIMLLVAALFLVISFIKINIVWED